MQKIKCLTLIVIFLLFLGCNNSSKGKIKLGLKLDKGFEQTLIFENVTQSNSLGEINEQNEIKFRLDSITKEGHYIITGKVVRMKYFSSIGGEVEKFDSDKKESEMTDTEKETYEDMKPYINSEFRFTMNKRGEVIKPAEFINGFIPEFPIKDQTILPLVFPAGEISIGHEWSNETPGNLIESQKINSKYKLKLVENNKIHIEVNQEIGQISGLLGKTEAHGVFILDEKTNTLIKGEREMKMQVGGGKVIYKVYPK